MKYAKVLSLFSLAGLFLAGNAGPSAAETFKMICKNSRYTYSITFDDEAKRFHWASDAGQADFYVVKFKTDEDGLTVWGKVRRYGYEFVAYFSAEGWMKTYYANGSSMSDVCKSS